MQERRPTWCRGACPDLVWENFVLMLFSSSLENSWRNQGRSPCWVGLWWKMPSCLLLRPWTNRRPAPPQPWRSISWKITQGPTPTCRVKYWSLYRFYSACWESCSCRCACAAPLNCSVELAGSCSCSALCAAEMLCGFCSISCFQASSWDRMHDSLVYSQEGGIVFKYFIVLKSSSWFHISLLWKGQQLGINAIPNCFLFRELV